MDYGYVTDESLYGMSSGTVSTLGLVFAILSIIGMWKLFTKANEHGWAAIIPIYNTYVLFKITTSSGWFFLLLLIPVVNAFVMIYVLYKLAKVFGHGIGFALGLIFLEPIFIMILGFGSSEYIGKEQ
jgi:hypothetical protein